jgi:hypothetical protein
MKKATGIAPVRHRCQGYDSIISIFEKGKKVIFICGLEKTKY